MAMMTSNTRNIVFLTGTRADFGKLKSLMCRIQKDEALELHIFVTGMHMLSNYGYTCQEVEKAGFRNIHKFINQNASDSMDHILSKTISGLSDYVKETKPDLLIVHGDRVETLAGAAVGALNNVLVGHIEGGEVSGTVDELIRHAVSKLSHIHFVSNESAKGRLIQLGEKNESIHVIGSPDVDVMNSSTLPDIDAVRKHYAFNFDHYGILIFHPVTTELEDMPRQIDTLLEQLLESELNYVVIYPNNDIGTDIILSRYRKLEDIERIRIYPSMRFEFFLTMLKHADFIIGNSSAGVREAPHFGVPTINVGTRQNNRASCSSILHVPLESDAIKKAMIEVRGRDFQVNSIFGNGGSDEKFYQIIKNPDFWKTQKQKTFVDWSII